MQPILLAPARRADAADLIAVHLASRAHHAPWAEPFTDAAGFEDWFATLTTAASAAFVARDRESGDIVGVTSLSQIFLKGFRSAYLSYHGNVAFARTGRMTEAVRLTVAHAFAELGLHRLEANIQPGNASSRALVRRLGFRQEGFSPRYLRVAGAWCDHERWALLADEDPAVPRPEPPTPTPGPTG